MFAGGWMMIQPRWGLISNNTILDGSGHQITISGSNFNVFYVDSSATLGLVNLTLTNGGVAIGIPSGVVCATNCIFTGNNSYSYNSNPAQGGAILNAGGILNLQNCLFTNNSAIGSGASFYEGADGAGGAIFNTGSLNADNCQFVRNVARGSSPIISGYPGTVGGYPGYGGAIYNSGGAVISRSLFLSNSVVGGFGGTPSSGHPGADGGPGSDASGGAIYSVGTLLLLDSTVAANTTIAGAGGAGGPGGYGTGQGGNGGNGGSAFGAIFSAGTATLVNVTLASNTTAAGSGGGGGSGVNGGAAGMAGSSGSAYGTIYGANLANDTVALNSGGGIYNCILTNTLLANSNPWNCSGTITDRGHNLSSDASHAFTGIGSMTNTVPKLGPLADNGGPTLTMALLAGSPAIDAGSAVGAPATDQRGVPRPQGHGVDIGAFEYLTSPIFTGATIQRATNCQMQFCGLTPNQSLTLQVSTNLLNWQDATNFMAGSNGVFQCVGPIPGNARLRFYRLKSGTP